MTKRHSYTCFTRRSTYAGFASLLWLTSAVAQEPSAPIEEAGNWFGGSPAYEFCLGQVETDPDQAFDRALNWQDQGGGPPAHHCGALALVALGHYADGADRLDTLAQDTSNGLGTDLRAEILIQAANAWMMEGFPGQARESLNAALALDSTLLRVLVEAHFDMARAHIMDGNWEEAIEELDFTLDYAPGARDALVLRATGHRTLEQLQPAMDDLTEVLTQDPDYMPALIERGVLWRMLSDDNAAREDWIKVLMLEREGEMADAARAHLHDLDFPDGMAE